MSEREMEEAAAIAMSVAGFRTRLLFEKMRAASPGTGASGSSGEEKPPEGEPAHAPGAT